RQLKDDGVSILLVSHDAAQIVQHCDEAVLLDGGRTVHAGKPKDVVHRYHDLLFGKSDVGGHAREEQEDPEAGLPDLPGFSAGAGSFESRPNYNPYEYRWGDGAARIVDFELRSATELYPSLVRSGASLRLTLRIVFDREVVRPILGFSVKTKEGVVVYGCNTEWQPIHEVSVAGTTGTAIDVTA